MLDPAFIRPTYGGMSFAAIPSSIAGLLGADQPIALASEVLGELRTAHRTVVLFLIDGFGWRFMENYADRHPALRRFVRRGMAAKISAQFPSTTASHVTCLHTGLEVGQSGVYEWQYYEPQLDAVITPLLFSFAGTLERDQLKAAGVAPAAIYPTRTIYQQLAGKGIASYVFQHKELSPSTFSDVMFAGATRIVTYKTLAEGLVNLRLLMAQQKSPAYFTFYLGNVDTIGHDYGPNSRQLAAEIDTFLTAFERHFLAATRSRKSTLCLVTADHGMVEVDPATTIYINTDSAFSGLERFLRTDRQGRVLVPGGSARDAFLYIKEGLVEEAQAFLAPRLAGRAVVYRVGELIDQGFFGSQPVSRELLSRVGDLVILSYRGEAVWWFERDRYVQRFYGHHGGLTPQEMEIPLLAVAL